MNTATHAKSLVERTYETLLDAICSGELMPGDRLNQDEIATRLNVSRQPVNSAISILKANGFAEDTGRRSAIVSALSSAQFSKIFEFRAVIEPFAVTLAAERMPPEARREAEQMIYTGREAVAKGDTASLLRADTEFHQMIYRWSGNHVIEDSMRVNLHHIRRAMAEILRDPASATPTWDAHERIVTALLVGNTDEAAREMAAHIDQAKAKTSADPA